MKIVKKKIYGAESREKMLEGILEAAKVVGSTMGAKGRNVIVDKEYGSPLIINDGVTILNELFFDDQVKNAGVQLLKDAAVRTNTLAGDGTTTTTVLTAAILKRGWEEVANGANPVMLRKELEAAGEKINENLINNASIVKKEKEAIQVASISVQDEAIGKKIGGLMDDIGALGAVEIKESTKLGVEIERIGGMNIEGALSGGVVENGDKWETKLNNPRILILSDSPQDHEFELKWIPFIQQLTSVKRNKHGEVTRDSNGDIEVGKINVPELLIVAEKLSRRFIMAMNLNKHLVKWVWFRPSTAGKNMKEIYKDLAAIVDTDVINEEDGTHLIGFTTGGLGVCDSATVSRHELVISCDDNRSNRYLDRVNTVKAQIDNAEDETEKNQIKERFASLTNGVAVIRVLSATPQDTVELKLRIEDAINATRAAMEEGYVPGGGVALFNAAKDFETIGEKILFEAARSILSQILYNAGYEDIDEKINSLGVGRGYNVKNDTVVDMKKDGIIDPLKVVRLSLLHAVSVAGLLLTSEYLVIDEKEDDVTILRNIFSKKD